MRIVTVSKRKNIFSIIVMFFIFITFYMLLDSMYSVKINDNIEYIAQDTLYYSCSEEELMNDYKDVVGKLKNTKYIEDVGYELSSDDVCVNGKSATIVYLGGYAAKIKYRLKSGEWIGIGDSKNVINVWKL